MRMCITGRELVLISPIAPRSTWLEKPGRNTRWAISRERAASAVRGRRKNNPPVSARIVNATSAESRVRRGQKLFKPLRAVTADPSIDRRISPEVSAAMANSTYSARMRKKLKSMERTAAASISRKAMTAVYR